MAKKIFVGAHMSIAGGYHKAIERGESIGCTAIQIFTKSNRSWSGKKITKKDADLFKETVKKSPIQKKYINVHTSYLINLAAKNPDVIKKSKDALLEEVRRCEALDIPYLVLHPGSHVGTGEEVGIKQIAKNIDYVLDQSKKKVLILLENMAGQGTNIGYDLKQLNQIRSLCKNKKLIGYCMDLCHLFAAGYPLNSDKEYEETMLQWEKIVGFQKLKVIHVNDSLMECGGKRDRHAPLGKGKMSHTVFKRIMNDKRFENIAKILETPDPGDMSLWEKEIKMLKKIT